MAILGGVATFGYVSISNSNQDEIEDIEPPEESGLLNNIDDITEDGVGNIDELNGSISSEENYIEDLRPKLSNEHSKLWDKAYILSNPISSVGFSLFSILYFFFVLASLYRLNSAPILSSKILTTHFRPTLCA